MRTIQINVGLSNNTMTKEEVLTYFASHKSYRLMAYYFIDKTFNDEVEPTFVALLESKFARQSKVLQDFENICNLMEQESIAIATDFMEVLAFNTSYDGDGYLFNEELFEYISI
jgi:hypothetical protein